MINYLDNANAKGIAILPEYIKIQGFTRADLLVYSIIMQFTKNSKEKGFKGSLTYLEQFSKLSRQGVLNVLERLQAKGYVRKEEYRKDNSAVVRKKYIGYSPSELAEQLAAAERAEAKAARRGENKAATAPKAKYQGRLQTASDINSTFFDVDNFDEEVV